VREPRAEQVAPLDWEARYLMSDDVAMAEPRLILGLGYRPFSFGLVFF
jgi:hypothetical protein